MSESPNPAKSLELSISPAFFAAGCCATLPLMIFFGFSLAEEAVPYYQWYFRGGGLLLLLVSLWWYFRKSGIHTWADYQAQRSMILATCLQVAVYSLLIYLFFVEIVTPALWTVLLDDLGCDTCSIFSP